MLEEVINRKEFDFLLLRSTNKKLPMRVVFYWYGFITTGRRTVRKFTQSVNLTREDIINIMGISVYAYRKQGKGNSVYEWACCSHQEKSPMRVVFFVGMGFNNRAKKSFNVSINRDVMIFIKKL